MSGALGRAAALAEARAHRREVHRARRGLRRADGAELGPGQAPARALVRELLGAGEEQRVLRLGELAPRGIEVGLERRVVPDGDREARAGVVKETDDQRIRRTSVRRE